MMGDSEKGTWTWSLKDFTLPVVVAAQFGR